MKTTEDELLLLRAHNPVPEQHDPRWTDSPEGRALFAQIAENMSGQPARRRPRWRRPIVTIPMVAAFSASALLFASAIARDKVVSVSAEAALADPSGVERQLANEGIQAEVRVVPVNDFLAGKWFHLYFGPEAVVDSETLALLKSYVGEIDYRYESVAEHCGPTAALCERTSILEIPGSVTGPITLVVGRAARPGEEYWARNIDWSNELAPSGAFYCHRLEGRTPTEAATLLQELGYRVLWVHEEGNTSDEVTLPPPGAEITFAMFRAPDVVDIRTARPPSAERYKEASGTPSQRYPRSSAPWAPDC
ncbi:MAG: hypothetical protein M3198_09325 [Actinomycetota bacterium]|nr:hypothetical protein [Actinomycetota bacterium]